mmetsp:Transcript_11522/g.28179  ORF Transcript_11522/g.28179 Transcript_11522/m.28179 type:complete len:273 (+) Transcript_11522:2890-3708(+)
MPHWLTAQQALLQPGCLTAAPGCPGAPLPGLRPACLPSHLAPCPACCLGHPPLHLQSCLGLRHRRQLCGSAVCTSRPTASCLLAHLHPPPHPPCCWLPRCWPSASAGLPGTLWYQAPASLRPCRTPGEAAPSAPQRQPHQLPQPPQRPWQQPPRPPAALLLAQPQAPRLSSCQHRLHQRRAASHLPRQQWRQLQRPPRRAGRARACCQYPGQAPHPLPSPHGRHTRHPPPRQTCPRGLGAPCPQPCPPPPPPYGGRLPRLLRQQGPPPRPHP